MAAYYNEFDAIVPQVAALFVKAYMDTTEEGPE